MKQGRGPWAFGALAVYKEGQRAGWIIRNFGAFLDEIGIIRPKVTQHSLRHRWIDAARSAGVPQPVTMAIAGHDGGGGVHDDYGDGFDVKFKLKWLKKVDPLKA